MPDIKTVAMRLLDQANISYLVHTLPTEEVHNAQEVADLLGVVPEKVFKTLVTTGKSGKHYVFMLPALAELDLKKAAKAAGEKSVEMLPLKELLGLTGYVHGGCSPIGMKKPYPVFIDETALLFDRIAVSAGVRGLQIHLSPTGLSEFVGARLCDITRSAFR